MANLQTLSEREVQEMSSLVQSNVMSEVVAQLQGLLDKFRTATLDIAVTGESGSGKSTFINAFRGLGDEEAESAPTGVTETTKQASVYPHPSYPTVRLWDLPGIGTPDFHPQLYLEKVNLEQNHVLLAQSIKSMGKKFYFVRSKIDSDINCCMLRRGNNFSEADVLQKIRDDCVNCLEEAGVGRPKVFLISCFEVHKFDFAKLQETLASELDSHKRHVFLLALPSFSSSYIEKKKQALSSIVWKTALSACLAAVLPGPLVNCNIQTLMETLTSYQQHFGVDHNSLFKLSTKTGRSYQELRSQVTSSYGVELSYQRVEELLKQAAVGQCWLVGMLEGRIPFLGNIVNGGVSFVASYYLLKSAIDELAEDGKRVMKAIWSFISLLVVALCISVLKRCVTAATSLFLWGLHIIPEMT
uniref:Immunity related GTPase cinema n=1 Tax=Erpetoichthys calabaricus TaxID=27687 RepID=A0A8C4T255_ERPCA